MISEFKQLVSTKVKLDLPTVM